MRQVASLREAIATVCRGEGPCRVLLHLGREVHLKEAVDADGDGEQSQAIAATLRRLKYWASPLELVVAKDVSLLTDQSVLLFSGNRLCEELNYEMDSGEGPAIWQRTGVPRQISAWYEDQIAAAKTQPGVHLLIHPKWHRNYTHWFTEGLTGLFDDKVDQTLIDSICIPKARAYQERSLALAGVKPERIRIIDQHVHRFDVVLFPTHALARTWLHPAVAPGLREFIAEVKKNLNISDQGASGPIYISREDAKARSMLNEADFAAALERIGFRKMIASEMSFEDQVRMLSSATALVSSHGSGLTNMIFLPEGAPVLELRPVHAGNRGVLWDKSYHILAGLMNRPYSAFVFDNPPTSDTWTINIPLAVEKATQWLARR